MSYSFQPQKGREAPLDNKSKAVQDLLETRAVLVEHFPDGSAYHMYTEPFNLTRIEFAGKPKKEDLDIEVSYQGVTPEDSRVRIRHYLSEAFSLDTRHLNALKASTIGMEGIAITKQYVAFYYPDRYYARVNLSRPACDLRQDHAFVLVPTKRPFIAIFTNETHVFTFEYGDDGVFVSTSTKRQSNIGSHIRRFRQRYPRH